MSIRSICLFALLATWPATLASQSAPPGAPRAPRPSPATIPAPVVSPVAPWFALAVPDIARASSELAHASAALAMQGSALRAASAEMARELSFDRLAPLVQALGATTTRGLGNSDRTLPPDAWDAQDPADSLYREARKALSSSAYQRAAELFKSIRQRYPKSSYASDAPYWEAFALQRLGGETNLRRAQDALGLQQREYPQAATRGDAAALNARIESALARRGDTRMASTIVGRAQRAANDDDCPPAEEDERIEALNAVAQLDAAQAMPILRKVLARREPCTQQLRRTAVWLVARQQQPDVASLLMNAAKTDPDRDVREQAVFWLASVPGDEALEMLIGLAKGNEPLEVRQRATFALSRSKSPRAAATLRELALDPSVPTELGGDALSYYLRSSSMSASESLQLAKELFNRGADTDLKARVLMALASRRDNGTREFLISTALNEREALEVRRIAVSMIMSRGYTVRADSGRGMQLAVEQSDPGVNALITVYDRAGDLELRQLALSGLAASRHAAGMDKLLDVARNEKNAQLRRFAVSYLSRSKDPRALKLLQEIIDK